MSVHKLKDALVLLYIVLITSTVVWPASKYSFPKIDQTDFSYYLNSQEYIDDHNIYLYSTLTFINRDRNTIFFDISKLFNKNFLPISGLNIYREISEHIQSEFFDFTIWGQMGNYFDKNIEIIELENGIKAVMKEIEKINKRYREVLNLKNDLQMQSDDLITIDKMNFLYSYEENSLKGSTKEEENRKYIEVSRKNHDIHRVIQMYEEHLSHERLKPHLTAQLARHELSERESYEAVYIRSAESSGKLKRTNSQTDNAIYRMFKKMMSVLKYLIENKLEAAIYLSALVLLTTFVTRLFKR
jgi:hypothetical protein